MSEEPLDCPFCGGDAYVEGNEESRFFVGCRNCFCNVGEAYDRSAMPEHMFATLDEAIAAWNRRSTLWQPIDTAPKDREIIVWVRGRQYIATWERDSYNQKPRPFWNYSDTWGKTGCRAIPPLLWMPLPASPQA